MVGPRPPDDPATVVRRPSMALSVLQTYGATLAGAILGLANALVIARTLGPTGRGEVVFLTALAWMAASLSTLGVQEANSNLAGAEPRLRGSLATNSILMAAIFGVVAATFLTALIAIFPGVGGESDTFARLITFAALPFFIVEIYFRFMLQADYRFSLVNMVITTEFLSIVIVNGVFALLGVLSVRTAILVWIAVQAIGTLVLAAGVVRSAGGLGRPDAALARRTLTFGLKSHAGRILLLGNYRLDQLILGAIAGPRELGLYSVAVAWGESLYHLPTTMAAVERPDFVRASRRDAARQAARGVRLSLILTLLLAAGMFAAADFLCATIFGEAFQGSVDDLRMLTLGVFGIVVLKQLGNALTGQRMPLLATAAIGVAFVATVGLDILLIPEYGGFGAALASTLSYMVGGVVIAVIFARALETRVSELIPRPSDVVWLWTRARGALRTVLSRGAGAAPKPDSSEDRRP